MSYKSELYAINDTVGTLIRNGVVYPFKTAVRRFGYAIRLMGNSIMISGMGYYHIELIATVTATTSGKVTITLYKDGIAIPGATASATVSKGDIVTLPITTIERLTQNSQESILTLIVSGQSVLSNNLAITVRK